MMPLIIGTSMQHALLPFVALEADGRILAVNQAAAKLFGRPAIDLVATPFADVVEPFSREKAVLMVAAALADGMTHDWELKHPRTDAPPTLISYTAWSWRTDPASVPAIAAIGRPFDATLSLASQLAASNAQLEAALLQLERTHAELKEALAQALRTFAHPEQAAPEAADLNLGLASIMRIVRAGAPCGVTIIEQYGELPPVVCNPGQINQVALNLLTNALAALQGDGEVVVSSGCEGAMAVITVRATGVGMDPTTLMRLGEPCFTTRPVGRATSLGLAISQEIAERHGGRLEFHSTPGQGTTARLLLPLTPGPQLYAE